MQLIEKPKYCKPEFLNQSVQNGEDSISNHLIQEHKFPQHTINVLTIDERYIIHDALHEAEYESIIPNFRTKDPFLVKETISFYHYLKNKNLSELLNGLNINLYDFVEISYSQLEFNIIFLRLYNGPPS